VSGPYKLLVVATHPIQYQAPLFRAMHNDPRIELTVAFCSEFGAISYFDPGFGQEVKWDPPLMDGYHHVTINNWSPKPNQSKSLGLINPGLMRLIGGGKWDAVWVHGWASASYWIAMLSAIASRKPLIIRGETHMLSKPEGLRGTWKKMILSSLFKRMRGVLAIGSDSADFYRLYGVPEQKIFLTPYAVNNDFFLAKADELRQHKSELKQKLGIAAETPVVLSVGKIYPGKRPMDLLHAFERAGKGAALVFVGDGASRPELEDYVRARNLKGVYFTGFQNQSALPNFWALADVFVMTSASETWGLVVNEAMCFSLPVLVSDRVTSGRDLVRDGENGHRFKVGDVEELSSRLAELLAHKDKRERFGRRSREIVAEFTYAKDVEGIVACLDSISARH
jgi:glycosyltransferase involved in cell wall biosynthesis